MNSTDSEVSMSFQMFQMVFPPFYWVLKKGKERKINRKERKGRD